MFILMFLWICTQCYPNSNGRNLCRSNSRVSNERKWKTERKKEQTSESVKWQVLFSLRCHAVCWWLCLYIYEKFRQSNLEVIQRIPYIWHEIFFTLFPLATLRKLPPPPRLVTFVPWIWGKERNSASYKNMKKACNSPSPAPFYGKREVRIRISYTNIERWYMCL